MNKLSLFNGAHCGLVKAEFVELLHVFPAASLNSLRCDLFLEAQEMALVPGELVGLPLVSRRDSALRPVTRVLSEDIWLIVNCINNKECIPRTLLKNGKRSKGFLVSQSSIQSSQSQTSTIPSTISQQTLSPSQTLIPTPMLNLPSQSSVSYQLVSRDINTIKDEIRDLKILVSQIQSNSRNHATSTLNPHLSHELASLKAEVSKIRRHLCSTPLPPSCAPSQGPAHTGNDPLSQDLKIKITSWNCRGLAKATPYVNNLINEGSDVIVLSEHWLWPFNLSQLQDIHPNFNSFGRADKRLHEGSTLNRGCGGVGIIWKRSLPISPISSIESDRFCVVQLLSDYLHNWCLSSQRR